MIDVECSVKVYALNGDDADEYTAVLVESARGRTSDFVTLRAPNGQRFTVKTADIIAAVEAASRRGAP